MLKTIKIKPISKKEMETEIQDYKDTPSYKMAKACREMFNAIKADDYASFSENLETYLENRECINEEKLEEDEDSEDLED